MSSAVHRYHDGTKHHFHQFARSLGYLDWASQPHPFRSFTGAPVLPLFPSVLSNARGAPPPLARAAALEDSLSSRGPQALAPDLSYTPRQVSYDRLFDPGPSVPVSAPAVGDLLRHALGLSAWKQYRESRWSLRVNPSSGNLHPTEAYLVSGAVPGLIDSPAVYHYASDRHALELRCALDRRAWASSCEGRHDVLLVALTSIHWREAWKYGERAFRYCQHDLGHAIAALVVAAAMLGWRARLLPAWSHRAIATLVGLDRDEDFAAAEREEPGCVLAIGPSDVPGPIWSGGEGLVASARTGKWSGRASQLSEDHVQWTFIDEIARATEDPGRLFPQDRSACGHAEAGAEASAKECAVGGAPAQLGKKRARDVDARALVLQRRSAVAFDGRSSIDRAAFLAMLAGVLPGDAVPWNSLWWTPRVHLALFVHRVETLAPGLYVLPRCDGALERLRAVFGREFLWEPADEDVPLVCLARGDCRRLAQRLSCDQEIAADGFFSLGMIAEFDASLADYGPSFYRHLFWETGFLGQFLYLEAEAARARATGIGCFYDDPVHDVLGLQHHACQSLYHFTVGIPMEDTRLTSAPGYGWS